MANPGFSRPPKPKSVDDFVVGAANHVQAPAGQAGDGTGLVRINIQVTRPQAAQLRRLAYERRVSQAELVRQALEEWLSQVIPASTQK